jgi:hypothetical protein
VIDQLHAVFFRDVFDGAFTSRQAALEHVAQQIVSGDKSPRAHWEIHLFGLIPPELLDAPLKAVTIVIPSGYRDAADFLKDCQFEEAPKLRAGLAEGCCSSVTPCSHQKRDPFTVCDICRAFSSQERP